MYPLNFQVEKLKFFFIRSTIISESQTQTCINIHKIMNFIKIECFTQTIQILLLRRKKI